MNTFTTIASNLTQSQAINSENTNTSSETKAKNATNDTPCLVISMSTDGKMASSVSKAITYIEIAEDEVLDKEINNGNTIKLSS